MVICALALRLKVVPSPKVRPSDEFAAVCTTSLRKMSSLTLSGMALLLRVTVAVPVTVATLPIGSSGARASAARDAAGSGAAAGAAGVCGACAGLRLRQLRQIGGRIRKQRPAGVRPGAISKKRE